MELRLDHLLRRLRDEPQTLLAAIDADPMLQKKTSGPYVLVNAGKQLFSPTEEHQLYAKGIVYERESWRLVSLPLIKIYNLNERDFVSMQRFSELIRSAPTDRPCCLHFLRKYDGSLIQRFQDYGRIAFTTRGGWDDDKSIGFDFTGVARAIAQERYPILLVDSPTFEGLTLVFELIHPETPIITHYGDRRDLLLLAVLDRRDYRYWTFAELQTFAANHGLTVVDAFPVQGDTLIEQIDSMLASIAGTDQEGAVLTLEFGNEVVFRIKVKSPDYLRLLRLMTDCTYENTAALLDADAERTDWNRFEMQLRAKGRDAVPEELLAVYREHFRTYQAYLADIQRLQRWCEQTFRILAMERTWGVDARAERKWFAERIQTLPHQALLFAALDGRLDTARIRQIIRTPTEAMAALALIGEIPTETS